jgi:hypothetical protein
MAAAFGAVVEGGEGEGVEAVRVGGGGALMRSRWGGEGARGGRGGGAGVREAGGRWRKKRGGGRRKKELPTGGPYLSARGERGREAGRGGCWAGKQRWAGGVKEKEKDRRERRRRVGRRV